MYYIGRQIYKPVSFLGLANDLVYSGSMTQVGIHEAKTHLSRLLRRVVAGEEIVIAKGGKPVARLVPIELPCLRDLGRDRGLFDIPDDFDDALPEEILAEFES
jgi:prevent-host-death family protein